MTPGDRSWGSARRHELAPLLRLIRFEPSYILFEGSGFSETAVVSKEWRGYALITFPEIPDINVLMMPRQHEPPLGVGESASVPSAAAIANAVYDATSIRFRELPFTSELVLAALQGAKLEQVAQARKKRGWRNWGLAAIGALAGFAGRLTMASPFRPAIDPIPRPDPATYSTATNERGRLAAAAGACNVCHASDQGVAFAGGRAFDTPFGTVYATNITPDTTAGIGSWSYTAFDRAMRQGVSRDGHHLYPAHPYTSFAATEDAHVQALDAYLMTQPAIAIEGRKTKFKFPFGIRPLMAGWNAMFPSAKPQAYDAARPADWNRGAYLVETLGHCSACHTDRNILGAEKTGKAHLSGGFADGFAAGALNGQSKSPVQWTEPAFYDYMRTGHSQDHGSASGPMAHVISALSPLPDGDIRAMAAYLASLKPPIGNNTAQAQVAAAVARSEDARPDADMISPKGARIFAGACASCHSASTALPSLALNTNLHSDAPDNLLHAVLHGVDAPAIVAAAAGKEMPEIAEMPSFSDSLNDQQIKDLSGYLRARFAPDKPAWSDVGGALQRIRSADHS